MKIVKLLLYLIVSLLMIRGYNTDASEPDSLLLKLDSAQQIGDSATMLATLYEIALAFDNRERYDSASIFYNRGIRIADSINDKSRLSEMQNNMGNIHLLWGNYRKALELYLSSLLICREINDSVGISRSFNNIGVIYADWGKKEIALEYYQRSYKVDSLLHDIEGQSKTLNNIAILFDEMGKKEKAINVYFRALDLAQQKKDHKMIALASGNIGGFYLEAEDYEQAAEYYFKTLEEYKLARSVVGQADCYILIGDLYRENKEFKAALDYYKQGLDIVLPMKLNGSIMNAYKGMHEVYKQQGNYKIALEYFAKLHNIRDSIFSVETSTQLVSLTSAYEIQQKDHEMELQLAHMNTQNSRIKRQQIAMIALVAGMVLIFIFTIMLIRQYRLRMRTWTQLLKQHDEILKNRQELILAKEKAEESDRLKTTFLVNVSHELRTPMNGIMGFTELLQKGNSTEDQNRLYLSYIASSSTQLLKVLNDIMDISAIETDQLKLDTEKCRPSEIFNDIAVYFNKEKAESNKENLYIKYLPPEGTEDHQCLVDKKRLAQVIYNLVNNALIYTMEGGIEFGYEIVENAIIRIFVKDTGIGIERSHFEMIFERFRQVDDSTTRKHGGSGLGLAISKELVSLMNGRIYLESEIGKGSTFYVEIPYIPAH